VAPLVAALVDRSLVARHGAGRYRLLETLRAYAAERLGDSGEGPALADRHAAAVVAAAERLDRAMAGPEEAAAVAAMTALLPELRAARAHARAVGDEDLLVRLAAAMIWYGYHGQRYEVLGWGLDAAATRSAHPRSAVALAVAVTHEWGRGDLDAARELGLRALAAAGGELADAAYWAHNGLGDVALVGGDVPAGLRHYGAMVAIARRRAEPALEAMGVCAEAMIRAWSADTVEGVRLGEQGVKLAAESGNPTAAALADYALGEALGDHEPERAVALLARAAATARTVDCRLFEGAANTAAVAIRSRHGDPRPALADFREVLAHWRRTGNDTLQGTALRNLVVLLARIGADEPAALISGALDDDQRLYRAEAERLARARTAVAERLGPARLEVLCAEAQAMTPAQLLDRVLGALDHDVNV
jgi:tetratricopeptide (TPR) repeat protein